MKLTYFLLELRLGWFIGVVALVFVAKAYWQRREHAFLFLGGAILAFLVGRVFDALSFAEMMASVTAPKPLFTQSLRLGAEADVSTGVDRHAVWRGLANLLQNAVGPGFALVAAIFFAGKKSPKEAPAGSPMNPTGPSSAQPDVRAGE